MSHFAQGIARARPLQHAWALLLQLSGCLWVGEAPVAAARRGGGADVSIASLTMPNSQRTCSLPGLVVRRATFETLATYVAGKYQTVDFVGAAAF